MHRELKTEKIERCQPADLIQIARLEAELFPEPLSLPSLILLWLKRNCHYLVSRQDGRVAAYIGFQVWGPLAHTISMGVHPAYRRRGLATRIQKAADRLAEGLGARWFMGEVRLSNRPQLKLLIRLGWVIIGFSKGFFGDGEDAVIVWNPLGSTTLKDTGGDGGTVIHAESTQEQEHPPGA